MDSWNFISKKKLLKKIFKIRDFLLKVVFMISFSIGIAPISQIIISEIFPTHLRGTGVSL